MQDGWGNVALIGACQEGHAETAQVLLHGSLGNCCLSKSTDMHYDMIMN